MVSLPSVENDGFEDDWQNAIVMPDLIGHLLYRNSEIAIIGIARLDKNLTSFRFLPSGLRRRGGVISKSRFIRYAHGVI